MSGELYLGLTGAEVELPRAGMRFSVEPFEIGVEQRTADGTLVSDLRAIKHRFKISYDPYAKGTTLDILEDIYDSGSELSFIVTNEDETTTTYAVKMRPIPAARAVVREVWLWSGVVIVLEEL